MCTRVRIFHLLLRKMRKSTMKEYFLKNTNNNNKKYFHVLKMFQRFHLRPKRRGIRMIRLQVIEFGIKLTSIHHRRRRSSRNKWRASARISRQDWQRRRRRRCVDHLHRWWPENNRKDIDQDTIERVNRSLSHFILLFLLLLLRLRLLLHFFILCAFVSRCWCCCCCVFSVL